MNDDPTTTAVALGAAPAVKGEQSLKSFLAGLSASQPPDDRQSLRDWAVRINNALADGYSPNARANILYLPHRAANDALIRLCDKHPMKIQALRRAAAECENVLDEIEAGCGHADELADAMGRLAHQIEVVADAVVATTLAPHASPPTAHSRPKMTKIEANIKARDFLKKHPNATARKLAAGIGCASGLVSQLSAWKAVKEQRDKGRLPRKATVTRFTSKLQKVTGIEDDPLDKLIAEQEADAEPSPLDPCEVKVYRK